MPQPNFTKSFYLAIKKSGRGYGNLSVRVTERQPSLAAGEVAIKTEISLPAGLFERPQLRARIEVAADKIPPFEITAQVRDNIAEIVAQQTGFDLTLIVEKPE